MFKFAPQISCRNLVDDFTTLLSSVPCPGQDFKTGSEHRADEQGSSEQETSVSCAMCLRDPFLCCHYLTHLLKKGATTCPMFASLHYRLGSKVQSLYSHCLNTAMCFTTSTGTMDGRVASRKQLSFQELCWWILCSQWADLPGFMLNPVSVVQDFACLITAVWLCGSAETVKKVCYYDASQCPLSMSWIRVLSIAVHIFKAQHQLYYENSCDEAM